jgi:hypothetical protein
MYTIYVTYSVLFLEKHCVQPYEKTYVIHVYPYEKHVSVPYVKHMGYFSWRYHMFLPYVKHVCHIRLTCSAILPVYTWDRGLKTLMGQIIEICFNCHNFVFFNGFGSYLDNTVHLFAKSYYSIYLIKNNLRTIILIWFCLSFSYFYNAVNVSNYLTFLHFDIWMFIIILYVKKISFKVIKITSRSRLFTMETRNLSLPFRNLQHTSK